MGATLLCFKTDLVIACGTINNDGVGGKETNPHLSLTYKLDRATNDVGRANSGADPSLRLADGTAIDESIAVNE